MAMRRELARTKPIAALGLFLLCACSAVGTSSQRSYGSYPPTEPAGVKVITSEPPNCDLEKTGEIKVKETDEPTATQEARRLAAESGAEYLQIQAIRQNGPKYLTIYALAYRCKR
jgi:hypothetical protein